MDTSRSSRNRDNSDQENIPSTSSSSDGSPTVRRNRKKARHGFAREESVTRQDGQAASRFHCHCRKSFTTRKKLVEHIRINKGGKLFKCERCSKRFQNHRGLTLHYQRIHGILYSHNYGCHGCGKVFATWEEHQHHRKFAGHVVQKLGKPTVGVEPHPSQPLITKFFNKATA